MESPSAEQQRAAEQRTAESTAEDSPAEESLAAESFADEAVSSGAEIISGLETWRGADLAAENIARPTDDVERPVNPTRPFAPQPEFNAEPAQVAADVPVHPPAQTVVAEPGAAGSKLSSAVGATRRRAAAAVKDSIVPRVERVRDRSVVMLEDTPDDSGLLFVIIAAVLFVLFIFLLILNTVIK